MTRSVKAGIGAVLALVLAFGVWWFGLRSEETAVFESSIPAVGTAALHPPQYAADWNPEAPGNLNERVVRAGDHEVVRGPTRNGVWLPDGRYLFSTGSTQVFDPKSGKLIPVPQVDRFAEPLVPGEALHRLNLPANGRTREKGAQTVVSFAPDLTSHRVLVVPDYDGDRNPIHMIRSVSNRVFSIGDWDYVRFSDSDGEDFTERYGFLRHDVRTGRWDKVLLGKRLVALWVSGDGRALLGLQQTKGYPCGGCSKAQQIVEVDPRSGKIARTYGVPDAYDKSWRVADVDKAGGRLLVRFVHRNNVPENLGVWQYDGAWSLVPGTDGLFTWWQGPDDRIEAQAPKKIANPEGFYYDLYWVHGTKRTLLKGKILKDHVAEYNGIPGSLAPLE